MASSTRPVRPSDRPTVPSSSSTDAALEADVEIDGRYRIETVLGTGAMGAVYRARHMTVGRAVAIKVLAPAWASHATMPARLREEARAASAIGHPGIVGILDAGSLPDGRPYLVMELLEGRSLAQVIGTEGPLDPPRAALILAGIARAIGAAHEAGIVHRDLKPENVMVTVTADGERIKVLDFGIAHAVAPLRARLTVPGTVMGTPEYMAPEQVRGDEASPAFDIYALGVIGFEALSGRVPIDGTTSVEIMAKKSLDPSPSLAAVRPDLPGDLVALVDGCLARNPIERPKSARVLAEKLEHVERSLRGVAVAMPPHPQPQPQPQSTRGRPWILASVAGLALVAAVAWSMNDPKPPREAAERRATAAANVPVVIEALEPSPGPIDPGPSPGERDESDEPHGEAVAAVQIPADVSASPEAGREALAEPTVATRCPVARRNAEAARRDQKWTRLLQALDARTCFPAAERTRLRTKAYMELRQWKRCAAVGRATRDPEVQRMVELCESRRG
jgi:serine/threonine protein kinase